MLPSQNQLTCFYSVNKAKPNDLCSPKKRFSPYERPSKNKVDKVCPNLLKEVKNDTRISSGKLRGLSQDLLERIKAKEAVQKSKVKKTIAEEKELAIASRLAELFNILDTHYKMENKSILLLENVCPVVYSSFNSFIESREVEEHIRILSQILPEWLTLLTVRKELYLKINKKCDTSKLADKIKTYELNLQKKENVQQK